MKAKSALAKLRRAPTASGEAVRRFIVDQVSKHPDDIARRTAAHFHITRQAVDKHLRRLVEEGALQESGQTRSRQYSLAQHTTWQHSYPIDGNLGEDIVWARQVKEALGPLPENVLLIWQHGFSEMFDNAIDHSQGTRIRVEIRATAATTEMIVSDDGVGIFRKIQQQLGLLDERHAILELSTCSGRSCSISRASRS